MRVSKPIFPLGVLLSVVVLVDGGQGGGTSRAVLEHVSLQEFPAWMERYLATRPWEVHEEKNQLTRDVLEQSLDLGRRFMINNQKPAGNFNYQYDFVKKEMYPGDNAVRQAGALWGLALMYQYQQDPATRKSLDQGLRFFLDHAVGGPVDGSLVIAYPGQFTCQTGTVALVALGIIDYLRTETAGRTVLGDAYRGELTHALEGFIRHLEMMRLESKHFADEYSLRSGTREASFNPYSDGEVMLCLIKAAKYLGLARLVPLIEDSSMVLAKYYTVDQWQDDPDSDKTKGFFQWSCMAFSEYQQAGWKDAEVFGDYVLGLAWWMIHTHHTLERTRNTGYAYEGIIHAYRLAKARNDTAAMHDLAYAIDRGMYKLTGWQVGGPLESTNEFLTANDTDDPLAVGGVMNHRREAPLRIDVTQHQMHSVILALKHLYTRGNGFRARDSKSTAP